MKDFTRLYRRSCQPSGPFDNLKLADGGTAVITGGTGKTRIYRMPDGERVKVWKGMSPDDYDPLTLPTSR